MVRVTQSPVPHVQRSLVLLPVSGKGVLTGVDSRGVLDRVDEEIADWWVGGGREEGEEEGWRGRGRRKGGERGRKGRREVSVGRHNTSTTTYY